LLRCRRSLRLPEKKRSLDGSMACQVRHSVIGFLVLAFTVSFSLVLCPGEVQAAPYMTAQAYCLLDLTSGQVMHGKKMHEMRPVASTTKILTAVLALEYAGLAELAVISPEAANTESGIGLKAGDQMTVEDLLKAALLESANDASVALAEHVAGSEDLFAYLMNKKAWVLGAVRTHFTNSSGLPDKGHRSTCYDLSLITRYALRNRVFTELVGTRQAVIKQPGYPEGRKIFNTNQLLGSYDGAFGVKTGTTDAAGKCLIAAAQRGNRKLISVVLRSWDRYADSRRLLDWGFTSLTREKVVDKSNMFKVLPVLGGTSIQVTVYPSRDVYLWLPQDKAGVEKIVSIQYRPRAPLRAGQKVGELEVRYLGVPVERVNLVAGHEVGKEPEGLMRLFYRFYLQLKDYKRREAI